MGRRTFKEVGSFEEVELPELTFFQKLKLCLFGRAFIGFYKLLGWVEPSRFYVFECRKHGLQVSYSSGWRATLKCHVCFLEEFDV